MKCQSFRCGWSNTTQTWYQSNRELNPTQHNTTQRKVSEKITSSGKRWANKKIMMPLWKIKPHPSRRIKTGLLILEMAFIFSIALNVYFNSSRVSQSFSPRFWHLDKRVLLVIFSSISKGFQQFELFVFISVLVNLNRSTIIIVAIIYQQFVTSSISFKKYYWYIPVLCDH